MLMLLMVGVITLGFSSIVNAQLHGASIAKGCVSPVRACDDDADCSDGNECTTNTCDDVTFPNNTVICSIEITNIDGHFDTLSVNSVQDLLNTSGPPVITPSTAMTIQVSDGATCAAGDTMLPCILPNPPGVNAASILLTFESYNPVFADVAASPLIDQATGMYFDLCNAPDTESCDPDTNQRLQAGASVVVVDACEEDPVECDPGDACNTPFCDPATGCGLTPVECDPGDACNTPFCDPVDGCGLDPVVCPPPDDPLCDVAICDPLDGCDIVEIFPIPPECRPATFLVTKDFIPDNAMEVEVFISCNDGLPITNSQVITEESDGVTFVVTLFTPGNLDCEITEFPLPSGFADSYVASALDGVADFIGNIDGCQFGGVFGGDFACGITNRANDSTYTVTKFWDVIGTGGEQVDRQADVTIFCNNEILSAPGASYTGNDDEEWWAKFHLYGETDTATVTVDSTDEIARCRASESLFNSWVDSDNGCSDFHSIPRGGFYGCTITNTVFFEGIPTLNRYSLALLALLMLGIGAVGFRRFS
jgi:hypothetical protein